MQIRGPKLLATKYMKPEKIGSIYVNPAWRRDNSRSLWEVHESTNAANEALHVDLEPSWILVTPRNSGVFFAYRDDGEEIFLLAASSVRRIIPWTTGEQMKMKGTRILLDQDPPPEASSVILTPDTVKTRPTTGTIVEVGDEVADPDLSVGARVLFSTYAGTEIELNGTKKMILDVEQVFGVLEEGERVA